jgi:protein gp37
MNRTKIEYLDFTWNPIVGCSGVGCSVRDVCWARRQAKRQKNRCISCYLFTPHIHRERLFEPLKRKKPSWIGVCFSGDLFDSEVKPEWRQTVLKVVEAAYWHHFLCLTKQIQRVEETECFPPNFWLGVSINRKDELWRLEALKKLRSKLVVLGATVSFEPLMEDLGSVDLYGVDWVIIGAQTNPKIQPKREWVENIVRQAEALNIPVFLKNNLGYLKQECQFIPRG